jgi:hypothetical protein
MKSNEEIAFDLLNRLLSGERGDVQLHLAMLLRKSSSSDREDDFFRWILPPALADLRLSKKTRDKIVGILCGEIARNPEEVLITTACASETGQAVKTAAKVLITPSRALTMGECAAALSPVTTFLRFYLARNSHFLPKADLKRLAQLAKELQNVRESDGDTDSSARRRILSFAPRLAKSLFDFGVSERASDPPKRRK